LSRMYLSNHGNYQSMTQWGMTCSIGSPGQTPGTQILLILLL
jgi:hypothetical protein